MLTQPTKLWLCTAPTDMRKQVDGLVALAKHHLGHDPLLETNMLSIRAFTQNQGNRSLNVATLLELG